MSFYADDSMTLHKGDALATLREMPSESVQCCVTSPPYYGLRDYGIAGQLGLEKTPDEYVARMVEVFREVKRVLKPDGTLWLNLGDSYAAARGGTGMPAETLAGGKGGHGDDVSKRGRPERSDYNAKRDCTKLGLKHKDLIGIPWRVAFALQSDGWYLRSDIIWAKPNPMPESVTDRPTKAHEYLFLLTKSARYYYDSEAIKEPGLNPDDDVRRIMAQSESNKSACTDERQGLRPRKDKQRGHSRRHAGFNDRWDSMTREEQGALGRNKRTVWTIATQPFSEAHFATFPPKLIEPCIMAGSKPGDTILDPFNGAGTTGLVSLELGREYVGIELNPEYCAITMKRLEPVLRQGRLALT